MLTAVRSNGASPVEAPDRCLSPAACRSTHNSDGRSVQAAEQHTPL